MKISRRELMGACVAGGTALAQPARSKGPLVWLDMDQKELDDAYTQSVYASNSQQVASRYATNSEITRLRIGAPRRLAYGPTEIEGLGQNLD